VKIPLGLWEGSSENKTVANALLSDFIDRGLDAEPGVLVVSTAPRRSGPPSARCSATAPGPEVRSSQGEERRRAPARAPPSRRQAAAAARVGTRRSTARLGRASALAAEQERSHPGATASLREGLEETLTVTLLGVNRALKRTLESTNPCESMIECVRRSSRNVKRWHKGEMGLRWTAAGMLEAERQFRRIIGHSDLAKLAVTVERDTPPQPNPVTTEGAAIVATA